MVLLLVTTEAVGAVECAAIHAEAPVAVRVVVAAEQVRSDNCFHVAADAACAAVPDAAHAVAWAVDAEREQNACSLEDLSPADAMVFSVS